LSDYSFFELLSQFLVAHESIARLAAASGVLILLMIAEWRHPRATQMLARGQRWPQNFAMAALNMLIVSLIIPLSTVSTAYYAETQNWGILRSFELPVLLGTALSVIVLDFVIYGQHRMLHKFPFLWRFHRLHHADPEFDVSTALRFHPAEIVLSLLVKFLSIAILGISVESVIIFEISLNAMATFNHANFKLPQKLDQLIRMLIVTPEMHRIHHSIIYGDQHSNFGFNLSLWDRIFRTYAAKPQQSHSKIEVGLQEFQKIEFLKFSEMLKAPFWRTP
jgi:sterol desaturase/sphingolipid hydroxylase (fatty acid hydroxylase superfamily)